MEGVLIKILGRTTLTGKIEIPRIKAAESSLNHLLEKDAQKEAESKPTIFHWGTLL